jgi:hypothetical protein
VEPDEEEELLDEEELFDEGDAEAASYSMEVNLIAYSSSVIISLVSFVERV